MKTFSEMKFPDLSITDKKLFLHFVLSLKIPCPSKITKFFLKNKTIMVIDFYEISEMSIIIH